MCVCLGVGHTYTAVQTRLNWSRYCFGHWFVWAQEYIRWGRDIPWETAIFAGCSAHWKTVGVSTEVYAAKEIIQSSITAWRTTVMPPTGRCHITLFREKSATAMRLSSKILWPLVNDSRSQPQIVKAESHNEPVCLNTAGVRVRWWSAAGKVTCRPGVSNGSLPPGWMTQVACGWRPVHRDQLRA